MAFLCILSYAAWHRAKVPLDAVMKRRLKFYEPASSKLLIADILLALLERGLAKKYNILCVWDQML
jgi:hypothetical protein